MKKNNFRYPCTSCYKKNRLLFLNLIAAATFFKVTKIDPENFGHFASALPISYIEYAELDTQTALRSSVPLKTKPKYTVQSLEPFFIPRDVDRYSNISTIGEMIDNWDSRVGIRWDEVQFDNLDQTSINMGKRMHAYFGLLHSHTGESDGQGTPQQALSVARDVAKLDFMAVTDHSDFWTSSYQKKWDDLGKLTNSFTDKNFVAIRGFEYSDVLRGHYVVLYSDNYRSSFSDGNLKNFYSWLQKDEQKNSLVFFAHPGFHSYRKWWDLLHFKEISPTVKNIIVGSEVLHMNLYRSFFTGFEKQLPYIDEAIQKGWRLGAIASQDNHKDNWGIQDGVRLGVLLSELTPQSLKCAIKHRRYYATSNQKLQFAVNIQLKDGSWAPMGSQLLFEQLPKKFARVKVRYADADGSDEPYAFEIMLNGYLAGRTQFFRKPPELYKPLWWQHLLPWSTADGLAVAKRQFIAPAAGEFNFDLPLGAEAQKHGIFGNPKKFEYFYIRFFQGVSGDIFTQSSPIFIE